MEVGDARFVSETRSMTSNPRWMQRAELVLAGVDVDEQVARVSVWDKRFSKKKGGEKMKCLGAASFPLARLETFRPTALDLALEGGSRDGARVALALELRDAGGRSRRVNGEKTKRAEATRARRAEAATPSPPPARASEVEATAREAVSRPRESLFGARVTRGNPAPRRAEETPRGRAEEAAPSEEPLSLAREETKATPRGETDDGAPGGPGTPAATFAHLTISMRERVGEGDVSASPDDDSSRSNRTPRGETRARADSPLPPSPAPARRPRAPEVSFFGMTTPPPAAPRATRSASKPNARARVSATPEPPLPETPTRVGVRSFGSGDSVDGLEATRVSETKREGGEDASTPVPETPGRDAEARDRPGSERAPPSVDPARRVRASETDETSTESTESRTPPRLARPGAVVSPVADRPRLTVRTRAAPEARRAEATERRDSAASPPARPGTPVPPLGHAAPFGSFGPVDRTGRGSPARPPLDPRARRASPPASVPPSERECAALRPRRVFPAGKENRWRRGGEPGEAGAERRRTAFRAFARVDDDAVALATTRAVVAVELDEARRLGQRLARAEAALDAL